ncbi:MAG: iron export transporter permease subunit FetB [Gemmatimonadetes bacterium]|jgi:putative ABC transport system permease protein|nr:iron export transporter permease subunit FetB [Gemmatimonadota bacterium]
MSAVVMLLDAARGTDIELGWSNLALASALVFVAAGISAWQRVGLARGFLWGAVRAVVQLVGVGYILTWVFAIDRWYVVLAALAVMLLAATITITGRHPTQRRTVGTITGVAMLVGAGLTLAYVGAVVVHVTPWYDPRYLIPLFGMIVGNAMTGAALAAERLASEMESRRRDVEAYLALGASPAQASAEPVRLALRASLLPAVNGLMVVGLVTLPGMMTGQILAGASPLLAVRYQIVVVLMLAGAGAITSAIVVLWYRRTFFTATEQLASSRR